MTKVRTSANICLSRHSHDSSSAVLDSPENSKDIPEADYASEMRCNDKEHENGRLSARTDPVMRSRNLSTRVTKLLADPWEL
jgi:hypothetical protein